MFSKEYKKWVQANGISGLTNTQHEFAEWLLKPENAKMISRIGDLDSVFLSIRKYLKSKNYVKAKEK